MTQKNYANYRGCMTKKEFDKVAVKMTLTEMTLEPLQRFFVGGERPSHIDKRRGLMNNRIVRFLSQLDRLGYTLEE
jgi:hypothetical protein